MAGLEPGTKLGKSSLAAAAAGLQPAGNTKPSRVIALCCIAAWPWAFISQHAAHAITTCTTAACPCAVLCSLANRRTRCDAHGLSAFPPKIRKTIGSKAQAPLAKKSRASPITPYTHQKARAAVPRPPHCTRPRRLHSSPRACASQVCSQALASAAVLQPCSESSRRAPKLSHGGPER